jgi:hypothetical protein
MRIRITHAQVLLRCFTVLCTCLLGACYFPRQAAFESSVRRQVQIGMPVDTAQENLKKLKLACQMQGPQLNCTRMLERLPMTCIQHVALRTSQPQGLVTDIVIPKIACIGGFG